MQFARKGKKETKQPEHFGRVTDNLGCAVWLTDDGYHDIRLGEARDPKGKPLYVRTVWSIKYFFEMVQALAIVGETFANEQTVPKQFREELAMVTAALATSLEALRESGVNGEDKGSQLFGAAA